MQVRVGDMVRVGAPLIGCFFGLVVEITETQNELDRALDRVVTLWRPELPPSQQIQTWPLEKHYHIEVVL